MKNHYPLRYFATICFSFFLLAPFISIPRKRRLFNCRYTAIQRSSRIPLQCQVTGGDAAMILWEPAQGISCTHCLNPVATPDASARNKLTIQNEYSCTATVFATLKTFTARKINIPGAFMPNYDGLNDIFYIMAGKEVKKVVKLSVFNR